MLTDSCQELFIVINYSSNLWKFLPVCSEVDTEVVINVTFTAKKRTTECKLAHLDVPKSQVIYIKNKI